MRMKRGVTLKSRMSVLMLGTALSLLAATAGADEYDDTIALFKNAGESGAFFAKTHGYAVFPTIGSRKFRSSGRKSDRF